MYCSTRSRPLNINPSMSSQLSLRTPRAGKGWSKPGTMAMRLKIAKRCMSDWVAVDTSVLVGMLNPRDQWHDTAVLLFTRLQDEADAQLVIFDCVLAESVSVICRRFEEKGRLAEVAGFLPRVETQFPSDLVTWIMPEAPRCYGEVLALMRQTNGRLNFNDALIALLCRSSHIYRIASFDIDFDLIPWVTRIQE